MASHTLGILDRPAPDCATVIRAFPLLTLALCGGCLNDMGADLLPPASPPGAPVLYGADSSTTGDYTLHWTSPAGATEFALQEGLDEFFTNATFIYRGTDTLCAVYGRPVGATFYYRVRASNGSRTSAWSSTKPVAIVQAPTPGIVVSPLFLDFGYVHVDSSRIRQCVIRNRGGATLSGSCQISNYLFFQLLTGPVFSVPPGDSVLLAIRFSPVVEAAYTGTLVIASNDPVNTAVSVPLLGTSSTMSGIPDTIIAFPPSDTLITVRGGAGPDSSLLTFEVQDSLGRPIDIAHSQNVSFSLTGIPSTIDASVSPSTAPTNSLGRVSATVSAGTIPGTIQCTASLRRITDGMLIQSPGVTVRIQ